MAKRLTTNQIKDVLARMRKYGGNEDAIAALEKTLKLRKAGIEADPADLVVETKFKCHSCKHWKRHSVFKDNGQCKNRFSELFKKWPNRHKTCPFHSRKKA